MLYESNVSLRTELKGFFAYPRFKDPPPWIFRVNRVYYFHDTSRNYLHVMYLTGHLFYLLTYTCYKRKILPILFVWVGKNFPVIPVLLFEASCRKIRTGARLRARQWSTIICLILCLPNTVLICFVAQVYFPSNLDFPFFRISNPYQT